MIFNKKRSFFITGLIIYIFFVSSVYAFYHYNKIISSPFNSGKISIELTEYELIDNSLIPYKDSKKVFPGDVISDIPRITSQSNDCFIRVKISSSSNYLKSINLNDYININLNNWIYSNGYWYYKKELKTNEYVDVFSEFTIPENLNNKLSYPTFKIDITAEAIQSKNFNIDLNSQLPWGDAQIEATINNQF